MLGIALIAVVVQVAACTPAAAPTPTAAPAPIKPAASTPAPTKPAATTAASAPGLASNVTDCGTDLACFIQASRTGSLAKVNYTMAVDFFGMFLANTDALAIKGKDGDKLLFSQKTISADAAATQAMVTAAQAKGISDAGMAEVVRTGKGLWEVMQAASVGLSPEAEKQLSSARESQRARIGTGKECSFPQPALTVMLERWRDGKFSSSDYDPGQCTDLKAETASTGSSRPPSTPITGAPAGSTIRPTPTAVRDAAPVDIDDLPVPPNFEFESGGGMPGSDNIFMETTTWTGKASMQEIADFYASRLAVGWESRGGVVGDAIVEVTYDQKNTDPVVFLILEAEPSGGGVTLTLTLSNDESMR